MQNEDPVNLHRSCSMRPLPGWVPTPLLLLPGLLLVACGDPPPPETVADDEAPARSIVQVAQAAGQFSALLQAVEAAGLTETLQDEGPFTVFAPTDGAFASLPDEVVDELMGDPDALAEILLYHVVPGEYTVADLRGLDELESAQGAVLTLEDGPRGLTVQGVNMLTTDIRADNGIIHVVTAILSPEDS